MNRAYGAEVIQVTIEICLLEGCPSILGAHVRETRSVENTLGGTLGSRMSLRRSDEMHNRVSLHTFFFAIKAFHRRLVGTFSSRVSLLLTDTTGACEHARVGAVCLRVANLASAQITDGTSVAIYPSSPQLKHLPSLPALGLVGQSRALWPDSPQLSWLSVFDG